MSILKSKHSGWTFEGRRTPFFGGGSPSGPTSSTVTNTNIPEYARPYVESMLGATQQQLFNTSPQAPQYDAEGNQTNKGAVDITGIKGYTPYSQDPQDYVAGFSPLQQQAQQGVSGMQLPGQYGMATNAALGGLGAYGNLGNAAANQQFMNPYLQNALTPQLEEMRRQYGITGTQEQSAATGAGAFGGSREALMASENARNMNTAMNQAIGQGYNTAFNNAQQMQLAQAQGLGQAAQGLGALGGQMLQGQQGIYNLQNQFGQQQQNQQQNIINQAVQNYATAQQYPQQQLAFMNAMIRGLPLQTMTTQGYQAPPSTFSQLGGLGATALGAYGAFGGFKGAKGGLPKDFEKVKSYDVGGAVIADLENMDDAHLAEQAKSSPSATVRRQAAQILADRQDAGIAAAQSNLPTRYAADGGIMQMGDLDGGDEYAGGGMVAFASGDLVDDEEDDDSTTDELDRMLAGIQSQNEAYADQAASQGIGSIGINPDRPSGVGIRPEAKAPRGIEALEARVIRQESGGRDFDKEGNPLTSKAGAKYAMQVMPATAKNPGFGIEPAKNDSPQEYNRVGKQLLSKLYEKYDGDEQLTLAAYNWGPGNVDKWLAGGRKGAVPRETRQYAGLAKGGIASIQHFDKGDLVQDDTVYDEITGMPLYGSATTKPGIGSITELVQPGYKPFDPKEWEKQFGSKKEKEDWAKFDTATADFEQEREAKIKQDEENAKLAEKTKDDEVKAADAAKKAEEDSPAVKMQKYLDEVHATIKQQRQQDKYMALMAAGLGAMGGTSPYAMANIGQGGMKGIESLLASNKITGARENALMKGQLGAYNLAENQKWRQSQANQANQLKYLGLLEKGEKDIAGAVLARNKLDSLAGLDPKLRSRILQEIELEKVKSPSFQSAYKAMYGTPYTSPEASSPVALTKEDLIKQAAAEKNRLGIS